MDIHACTRAHVHMHTCIKWMYRWTGYRVRSIVRFETLTAGLETEHLVSATFLCVGLPTHYEISRPTRYACPHSIKGAGLSISQRESCDTNSVNMDQSWGTLKRFMHELKKKSELLGALRNKCSWLAWKFLLASLSHTNLTAEIYDILPSAKREDLFQYPSTTDGSLDPRIKRFPSSNLTILDPSTQSNESSFAQLNDQ